jgi:hypothetical protein
VVTSPYTTSSATVAFGVVLFARPGVGAGTLALLLGLFNLIYGVWQLAAGSELRRMDKARHPLGKDQHAHPTAA